MTEPEDPEVVAMRERADRVMARRAQERAQRPAAEAEEAPVKAKKGGRRWYHWVFDISLLVLAVYFVKVRFFTKEPEAPAAAAKSTPSTSASVSAAAPKTIVTLASAEVRLGAGPMFAAAETVPPLTVVEVLDMSKPGFVKIRVPSGKEGWVRTEEIGPATVPAAH